MPLYSFSFGCHSRFSECTEIFSWFWKLPPASPPPPTSIGIFRVGQRPQCKVYASCRATRPLVVGRILCPISYCPSLLGMVARDEFKIIIFYLKTLKMSLTLQASWCHFWVQSRSHGSNSGNHQKLYGKTMEFLAIPWATHCHFWVGPGNDVIMLAVPPHLHTVPPPSYGLPVSVCQPYLHAIK